MRHHTEWDADRLEVALTEDAAAMQPSSQVINASDSPVAKRQRGRRAAEAWWRVMVEVGAWLRDEGEPKDLEPLEAYIHERLAVHGKESNSESYVRERATLARDAFRAWKAGN